MLLVAGGRISDLGVRGPRRSSSPRGARRPARRQTLVLHAELPSWPRATLCVRLLALGYSTHRFLAFFACICVLWQAGGPGASAARRGVVETQLLNMATATGLLDELQLITCIGDAFWLCCSFLLSLGHKSIIFFQVPH